ncbi:MAG: hypothetical protein IJZ36_04985 [Bacilli bacterium]|nr:hypothetical protein [Bacilli bacterium]
MTAIEKAKLQATVSVIALSMLWCTTSSQVDTMNNNQPTSHLGNNHKIEVALEDEKQQKKMQIRIGSTVKKESVRKAKEIINHYLDKKDLIDLLVITNGNNVEHFGLTQLHVDLRTVQEGDIVSKSKGIQVICAEEQIQNILPIMMISLNQHFANNKSNIKR